jgi:hypothetical protein
MTLYMIASVGATLFGEVSRLRRVRSKAPALQVLQGFSLAFSFDIARRYAEQRMLRHQCVSPSTFYLYSLLPSQKAIKAILSEVENPSKKR